MFRSNLSDPFVAVLAGVACFVTLLPNLAFISPFRAQVSGQAPAKHPGESVTSGAAAGLRSGHHDRFRASALKRHGPGTKLQVDLKGLNLSGS